MTPTSSRNESSTTLRVEIDGTRLLSNELTAELSSVMDEAEDLGPPAVVLVHVVGQVNPTPIHCWPGRIDVQAVTRWERLLRRIERSVSLTIVFAEHACSGLALELLLVADRRLANGTFTVQHMFPLGNAWPGMALYRLSRQIGDHRTRKLFLDGTNITAELAMELSIVDEIINDLAAGLNHVAQLIANAPLNDFAVRRRLMQDSLFTSFDDALGVHLAACDRALRRC